MKKVFFSRLNYSFGNEDWRTELKALNPGEDDRVVCITGSGDRPLNLLVFPCKQLVSVDANPWQNNLLALKMGAMKALDFPDYLAFLEGRYLDKPCLYQVLSQLEDAIGEFWLKQERMLQAGVLYQGAVERFTSVVASIVKMVRNDKVKRLFSFESLPEQSDFVNQHWDSRGLRKAFDIVLHPFISKRFIKDPGLYENLATLHPGKHLYQRIDDYLKRNLARESLLLSLLFLGKVCEEAYPPYLTQGGFNQIKPRLGQLQVVTDNIINYLEHCEEGSIDCYSLSDVASYLTQTEYRRLLRAIVRTARPGSRFCMRQFLSGYIIPDEFSRLFKRDRNLESELQQMDRCFVYNYTVGTLAG